MYKSWLENQVINWALECRDNCLGIWYKINSNKTKYFNINLQGSARSQYSPVTMPGINLQGGGGGDFLHHWNIPNLVTFFFDQHWFDP